MSVDRIKVNAFSMNGDDIGIEYLCFHVLICPVPKSVNILKV